MNETLSLPLVGQYMDLPKYNPTIPTKGWKGEVDMAKYTATNSSLGSKVAPAPTKSKTVPTTRTTSAVPGAPQSLENILLNEFDRQEEFHYSLISKLDELSKASTSTFEAYSQIKASLAENKEMLQTLKEDMEQVKQDMKQLNSRGLLQRIFHN